KQQEGSHERTKGATPKTIDMQEGKEKRTEDQYREDGFPRGQAEVVASTPTAKQVDQMQGAFKRDVGHAVRHDQVRSQESAGARRERQRAKPLQPAQIDFGTAIDAVPGDRQAAVRADQAIAQEEFVRVGQVRQLQ